MLFGALAQIRPDLFFFANADAIRVLPQLADLIAPVEWRPEKRSHKQNRETMDYARTAFDAGPARRCSSRRAGSPSGAGGRCTSGRGLPPAR